MKTITIQDGVVVVQGELTPQEKIAIGSALFDDPSYDDWDRVLFHTNTYRDEIKQ
jgi:hypothetical protein